MLRTLKVSDLAIIDEVELVLEPGFNVITGETGAGKSILLQALDVALGGRPDADLVRTGADEAVIEAQFSGLTSAGKQVLLEAGVPVADDIDDVTIRRVISRGGRSKAYVNGTATQLAVLRELAPQLVRVYGQDEHQALRRVESHRELLDAVGGLGRTVEEMQARHGRLVAARAALQKLDAERAAAGERLELLRFQLEELTRANLVDGEEERLITDRARLAHVERLLDVIAGAEATLYSNEDALVSALGRVVASLKDAERHDSSLESTRALTETALAELEEVSAALGKYVRGLEPDPARLEAIEDRLAELARLKRKYGGSGAGELIAKRDALDGEMTAVGGTDEAYQTIARQVHVAERDAVDWAKRLSVERRQVAHGLERSLVRELKSLALEHARFRVQFAEGEERALGPSGLDEIEFLLAANPGEDLRSLARVASGGELSRIMLVLKTLAVADDREAMLVFDEVDQGVGGAVAEMVGRKLRHLGRKRQVLSVTHLPVIAAFAEHHVMVTKRVVSGRTVSTAIPLGAGERVAELARMLGGARLTRESKEHAEQLLKQSGATEAS